MSMEIDYGKPRPRHTSDGHLQHALRIPIFQFKRKVSHNRSVSPTDHARSQYGTFFLRRGSERIGPRFCSIRQWIGSDLEMNYLASGSLSSFTMERCTRAPGCPESLPFPACCRVVDPSVHALGIKSQRVRDAHDDELSI